MNKRIVTLLLLLGLCSGCKRYPILAPAASVRPEIVRYGDETQVRLYTTTIAEYRFLGAIPRADGSWLVRLDPKYFLGYAQEGQIVVRPGDLLSLGPSPSVLVRFDQVTTTRLVLHGVAVEDPRRQH